MNRNSVLLLLIIVVELQFNFLAWHSYYRRSLIIQRIEKLEELNGLDK